MSTERIEAGHYRLKTKPNVQVMRREDYWFWFDGDNNAVVGDPKWTKREVLAGAIRYASQL